MVIIYICSLVVQAAHIPGMVQTADFMTKLIQYIALLELCWGPIMTVMDCKNISHAELAPLQSILQGRSFIIIFVVQQIDASIVDIIVCTTEVCQVKCNVPPLKIANCRLSRFVLFVLNKGDSGAWTEQNTGRIPVIAGPIRNSCLYERRYSPKEGKEKSMPLVS